MKTVKPVYLFLPLLLIVLCILLLFFLSQDTPPLFLTVFVGLLAYVVLLFMIYLFIENNTVKSSKEIEDFYTSLRQSLLSKNYSISNMGTLESVPLDSTNVLELMTINMKEIKEYYILSKNMARSSFRLSVSLCLLGFTLIASSIVSVFLLNVGIGPALVPAIGGAIVEVVAGTSLFVYKQSLDQLNKYYEALHENERFLSVVNITEKISPDKKDDVYMEIIRSQLTFKNKD